MAQKLELFKTEYDNDNNIEKAATSLAVYIDTNTGTAKAKMDDFIRDISTTPLVNYLGNNHEVYPKLTVTSSTV